MLGLAQGPRPTLLLLPSARAQQDGRAGACRWKTAVHEDGGGCAKARACAGSAHATAVIRVESGSSGGGKMLEARIAQGMLLKKLLDSIKDLVEESNFDCSSTAISLQAMDSSHVTLVAVLLKADGFDHYRADRPVSLGINIVSLSKILKCLGSSDSITLRAADDAEIIEFVFENEGMMRLLSSSPNKRLT
jgi:hypothetical protein